MPNLLPQERPQGAAVPTAARRIHHERIQHKWHPVFWPSEREGSASLLSFGFPSLLRLSPLAFPPSILPCLGLPSKSSESHHDRVRQYRPGRRGRKGRKEGRGICRTSARDPRLFARHRHEDVSVGHWGDDGRASACGMPPWGRGRLLVYTRWAAFPCSC